jgi:hypothetical protein
MRYFSGTLGLLFFITLLTKHTNAQTRNASVSGEYHLQGVMETASALLLKPDSTFEIFFSYGAIDRQGSGKWSYSKGKILLNSKPKPRVDFTLRSASSIGDSITIIKITSPNRQILPFFEVMVRSANGDQYGKTNSEGIYQIPKTKVTSIELFFSFCPERYSTFPVQNDNNYFEFRTEPWLAEIFSENIELTVSRNDLVGQHPLLKGNTFLFSRAK